MIANAVPSHFGKGGENAFNDEVRAGKELRYGEHFVLRNEASMKSLLTDAVQRSQMSRLFPAACTLLFKLNKIAIYQEGGHFLEHRDTAYAANHKATLLLALPSIHQGGDLVLRPQGGKEVTWKTENFIERGKNWIAFYTSILHEVKMVSGGTRAVMQFDIYIDDGLAETKSPGTFWVKSKGKNENSVNDFVLAAKKLNYNESCKAQPCRSTCKCY